MATATLPQQALKDHVFTVFERQWPNCPPAGTHLLPIGLAFENVNAGHARIDPRSKDQFENFRKSQDAAVARHQQRLALRNKELAKAKK